MCMNNSMRRSALLVIPILILVNASYFASSSDYDHRDPLPSSGAIVTHFTTRAQVVSLENFTYKTIDPGYPLSISLIGDIDDDSNPDLIGHNATHDLRIVFNVKENTFNIEPFGNVSDLYLPRYMELIDLDGNNRLNAMAAYNGSIFEWKNGKFSLTCTNNIDVDPAYGDVDSDGDIDLLEGARPDGIYIVRNVNHGEFEYETTNRTGLPEFSGVPSRDYMARAYMYEDINNDGWLDICASMGDYTERYPGQDYFWLSNGDGTWREFSGGCPTWDYSLPVMNGIASADFDNDGDQDFIINLVYNRTTLFENNYPDDWELHRLPRSHELSGFTDTSHRIGDMNNDGHDDIVISYSKIIRDENDNMIESLSRIGIFYNQGNLSFQYHLSNELETYELVLLPLSDIDQDGSLDIVVSPPSARAEGWSPFVLFNDQVSYEELELSPSWGSNVLRAGSYWLFDLISSRKFQYQDMGVSFNISISYYGINGPYSSLIVNLSKWWTYWTVPDFPSNNAYLLIEGMGMSTKYGPFTIYSGNDSKYLIKPSFSVSDNYLYGGREVSVLLEPDPNLLGSVSLDLTLEHSNGTIDFGSHVVNPGSVTSFDWTVPVNLFEPDCRFVQAYSFEGHDVVVRGDEGYNILDDVHFLEEVRGNNTLTTWRGYTSELKISCLSKDLTDLSHSSKFDITSTSDYFTVVHRGNGLMRLYGLELGSDWLRVDIDCFGVKKSFSSYITVERSVGTLTLSGETGDARTGDERIIDLSAYDLLDHPVELENDEMEWTLSGPGTILLYDSDHIVILCNGTGTVIVGVESDIGYGPISDIFSFEVLPLIQDLRLSSSGSIVIEKEIEMSVNAYTLEGKLLSGYDFFWNVSGNVSYSLTGNNSLMMVPHDDDTIIIEVETCYYDEFQIWSFLLQANLSLSGLSLSYRTDTFVLFETEYIDVIPLTYNGSTYPFEVTVELIMENPEVLFYQINGTRISLIGQEVGTTLAEVRVSSPYENVSTWLNLTLFRAPYDVIMHTTTDIVRDFEYQLDFDILDRYHVPISGYDINIENATFSDNGTWAIRAREYGIFVIVFHVVVYDVSLVKAFEFGVHPGWEYMRLYMDPVYVRNGSDTRVEPYLVLEDGNRTGLTNLSVVSEDNISLEIGLNGFIIWDAPAGPLTLTVRGFYLGLLVEEVFEIVVLEPAVLTDIFFLFHNSSGKKIVEVLAYDQYGINITELCTFTFIGEFEQVSENTVEILGDRLTVKVSLSGVEITRDILEVSCRKPFLSEKAIFALAASMLVIVIVVFIVVRKFVFIPSNLDQDEDAFGFPEE